MHTWYLFKFKSLGLLNIFSFKSYFRTSFKPLLITFQNQFQATSNSILELVTIHFLLHFRTSLKPLLLPFWNQCQVTSNTILELVTIHFLLHFRASFKPLLLLLFQNQFQATFNILLLQSKQFYQRLMKSQIK